MKSTEKLQVSYEKQKKIYEEARASRIRNRNIQIALQEEKIKKLQHRIEELKAQNQEDKEFESFESFRLKAATRSQQSIPAATSN